MGSEMCIRDRLRDEYTPWMVPITTKRRKTMGKPEIQLPDVLLALYVLIGLALFSPWLMG